MASVALCDEYSVCFVDINTSTLSFSGLISFDSTILLPDLRDFNGNQNLFFYLYNTSEPSTCMSGQKCRFSHYATVVIPVGVALASVADTSVSAINEVGACPVASLGDSTAINSSSAGAMATVEGAGGGGAGNVAGVDTALSAPMH